MSPALSSLARGAVLTIPPEILLYICSFLDIPDLAALASVSPYLAALVADPLLNRTRLLVVTPSRVAHALFALGPHGIPLRPTVADLVHRGVMRGLGIERRWRMGLYIYSAHSVRHYESSVRVQRGHASSIVSGYLRRRAPNVDCIQALHSNHVYPDVESSSPHISRSLLPVMRQLKWSIRRDTLSQMVRGLSFARSANVGSWLERRGMLLVGECERVRLAICPGVRQKVDYYEHLATRP